MAVCITVMTRSFGFFLVVVLFGWLWVLFVCLVYGFVWILLFCCLFVCDGVVCLFFKLPIMLATPLIFALRTSHLLLLC